MQIGANSDKGNCAFVHAGVQRYAHLYLVHTLMRIHMPDCPALTFLLWQTVSLNPFVKNITAVLRFSGVLSKNDGSILPKWRAKAKVIILGFPRSDDRRAEGWLDLRVLRGRGSWGGHLTRISDKMHWLTHLYISRIPLCHCFAPIRIPNKQQLICSLNFNWILWKKLMKCYNINDGMDYCEE